MPFFLNWAMNVGRMPVGLSSPMILPSTKSLCSKTKMSWVRISSSSIP